MVAIPKLKIKFFFPHICPKCGSKLNHVNAVDTEAKIYFVWCSNSKNCRFCKEWKLNIEGEYICL